MGEAIAACFDTAEDALEVLARLRKEGFSSSALTLMSAEPVHAAMDESSPKARSRVGAYAIIGGLVGAAGALVLTLWTAHRMGLVTGGMPIVTPWAFGIIVFELIALGAILAAVARMILEAGLARRGAFPRYDDILARGEVVLSVEVGDSDGRDRAKAVLAGTLARILKED
jgi:hypothetical protein